MDSAIDTTKPAPNETPAEPDVLAMQLAKLDRGVPVRVENLRQSLGITVEPMAHPSAL